MSCDDAALNLHFKLSSHDASVLLATPAEGFHGFRSPMAYCQGFYVSMPKYPSSGPADKHVQGSLFAKKVEGLVLK